MKTMPRAAIMVFSIGTNSADASDGQSGATGLISFRSERPYPPAAAPAQGTVAKQNGAVAQTDLTSGYGSTWSFWLFPAAQHKGDH